MPCAKQFGHSPPQLGWADLGYTRLGIDLSRQMLQGDEQGFTNLANETEETFRLKAITRDGTMQS
jgi:hypothetical protein